MTIGLPVFNGMPYLPDALASLLDQDEPNIEIILSDNASHDATEEYCRAVASATPGSAMFATRSTVVLPRIFSLCSRRARHPTFAWAAHDDAYCRSFISTCLECL